MEKCGFRRNPPIFFQVEVANIFENLLLVNQIGVVVDLVIGVCAWKVRTRFFAAPRLHGVRPFGRSPTTRSLGDDLPSPWLLTTYPSPGMIFQVRTKSGSCRRSRDWFWSFFSCSLSSEYRFSCCTACCQTEHFTWRSSPVGQQQYLGNHFKAISPNLHQNTLTVIFLTCPTVDVSEIPNNHLGCIPNLVFLVVDKLPTLSGELAGFLNHQQYHSSTDHWVGAV